MSTNSHLDEVKDATIRRFAELWRANFQANLESIQRNPGTASLRGKFKNSPCIVIGAGPSLDKNIRLLRQVQDKAVLIASDAALKSLARHEIKPAFVVSLDPQDEITKFYANVPHKGITLVAPTIVHPRVLDLWEGAVVFFNKHAPDIPVLSEIQKQLPRVGTLTPGGTVLSVAYDLAFQSGGDPIIFVGQDLSYSPKNTYSRSSENGDEDFATRLKNQGENIVFETDVYGQRAPTLKSMSVSRQWFHWAFREWKRPEPLTILNCSESGILDQCEQMSFSEAIYKYCGKKVNVDWLMKKALKKK